MTITKKIDFSNVEDLTAVFDTKMLEQDTLEFELYDGENKYIPRTDNLLIEGDYREKGRYRKTGSGVGINGRKGDTENSIIFNIPERIKTRPIFLDCVLTVDETKDYPFLIDISEENNAENISEDKLGE